MTEAPAPAESAMPVLSIRTVSDAPDVMQFVTDPVMGHVSEAIATWTKGYSIPPEPYYEPCTITLQNGSTELLNAPADVKVRGNWTTVYEKKPLRLKFAEKQSLLDLNDSAELKNWVLLASYKDMSILRDKAGLAMSQEILGADGLYAADCALVEVEINGEYWGVYLLTEQQQISSHRIDITKAEENYTGTDIGYFLEFDGYFTNEEPLQAFAMDYADNAPLLSFNGDDTNAPTITPLSDGTNEYRQDTGITIKSDIYSQEQHDFIASYVNNVYRILYYAAYEDKAYAFNADYTAIAPADGMTPQQAAEAVVNINSLADMYIISEVACDADIYWSSFFMDADFGEGGDKRLTFEAPWDFDSSMGNKDRCADGKGFYAASIVPDVNNNYESINPWLAVLMQEEWFRDIIREKWTAAYDGGTFTRTVQMIRSDAAAYEDAFTRNQDRWGDVKQDPYVRNELCRRSAKCKTEKESAEYLADWLEDRVKFLNDYWHK
ncbi:MAG: CotH kinase family protein [Oscillospiraceae bacterium]|nr:CotH kinase family protein [Oscillospiraceae bacterium]